ncbi:MAG: DUF4184 family protein [Chitinivibrionales bacterium]|nr:DUF4184 family protein [Chitinivibrionales bacterium]MBD3358425.1 DUF4184 family protein [Chitinivibrionales bacterium]
MPLTISHAAAAVPLRRFRLPTSALIFGTMVPDFEFFLRMNHERVIGHTPIGLLLFCIPVGLLGLVIFHNLLKHPLLSLLPHKHQAKLLPVAQQFSFFPPRRFGAIVLALLIGAVSHILWDSFTHEGSWFVERLALLRVPLLTIGERSLKVCDFLQHGSSAIGFAILVLAYRKWYLQTPKAPEPARPLFSRSTRLAVFGGMSGFACIGGLAYGFAALPGHTDLDVAQTFIATTVVCSVSAFLAAWIAYSVIWHTLIPRTEDSPTVSEPFAN